jgi:thiol-disulfide isomerase/thioredoxin/cytochrome c-type biogenesis protein CcmH/NrfG
VPALPATLVDGSPISTEASNGKVTVLNFWATWCPGCRAETPDLVAADRKLEAPDVCFLGIVTTQTATIVETSGVQYPTALGGPELYNAFGVVYTPTTLVIDAKGIVRARWVGGITPEQLAQFVADARAGHTSTYVSQAQSTIDALLAPQRYQLGGTETQIQLGAQSVTAAIAQVESIAQQNKNHIDAERTQRAEGSLLIATATAQLGVATSGTQKQEALVTLASGYGDQDRWSDAVRTYREALTFAPESASIVWALLRADYRLHDYSDQTVQSQRYIALRPSDGDGWSSLALGYQRLRRFHDSAIAYEKSLALLEDAAAKQSTEKAIADVADTAVNAANVYVSLGDSANAQRVFAVANAFGNKLAAGGAFANDKRNVNERTQEGLVAVALSAGSREPIISIARWNGPDLPGSLTSTLKYRLIVAAPADSTVSLHARGLRPAWIASFCADGLCAPSNVTFTAPSSGVKTYEFQLVPPQDGADPGTVSVLVDGGSAVAVPLPHS